MTSDPNEGHPCPTLIGDIGGTNARFQVVEEDGSVAHFEPVRTADFASVQDAIKAAVLRDSKLRPQTAILAAAGPIKPDGLDLTNAHWTIKADEFLASGPWNELVLMNDFEAQALALPFLGEDDVDTLGDGTVMAERNKAAIGPGTGLGVGTLIHAQGKWVPVAGEGGHVDLGPRSDREAEIWGHLDTIEGRISGEQILCGDGLENLYRACAAASDHPHKHITAADISRAALAGSDPVAIEALSVFCECLGRVAGDLALTNMAKGGIYIAGGIARQILPFLRDSRIRNAFEDKAPHSRMMRGIATSVVTHPLPALLGLAGYARSPSDFLIDLDHRRWHR
ncbi:MAG: glucokinase [Ahrensia sp.]|nr:glucokinase [Ahrensia sp.]